MLRLMFLFLILFLFLHFLFVLLPFLRLLLLPPPSPPHILSCSFSSSCSSRFSSSHATAVRAHRMTSPQEISDVSAMIKSSQGIVERRNSISVEFHLFQLDISINTTEIIIIHAIQCIEGRSMNCTLKGYVYKRALMINARDCQSCTHQMSLCVYIYKSTCLLNYFIRDPSYTYTDEWGLMNE